MTAEEMKNEVDRFCGRIDEILSGFTLSTLNGHSIIDKDEVIEALTSLRQTLSCVSDNLSGKKEFTLPVTVTDSGIVVSAARLKETFPDIRRGDRLKINIEKY